MRDRIGTLHLHYRVVGSDALGPALAPRLDRAIQHGLGAAVEERLAATLTDDPSVVVIRELATAAAIGPDDLALDSRVVDTLSRASADAVATALSEPSSADAIVRFADQGEFVGSFILDLLNGTAWDRWYYGAFQLHRDTDPNTTLASVLDDNRLYAASVFGWLSRHGRLDDVLARLGPGFARRLTSPDAEPRSVATSAREVEPLVAAAFDILAALGWFVATGPERSHLVAEYLATAPVPPAWSDRRSLTAWVLAFVRFAAAKRRDSGTPASTLREVPLHELLTGPLDWLDAAWLEPELADLRTRPSPTPVSAPRQTPSVLTARHERALERLWQMLRSRRIVVNARDSRDVVVVRLVAALAEDDARPARLEAPILATVERIADAFCRAAMTGGDVDRSVPGAVVTVSRDRDGPAPRPSPAREAAEALRATSPAGFKVLQQLLTTLPTDVDVVDSPGAPLFLLTRALLDARLDTLAHAAGVPFELLRAILANQWLGLVPPFDHATALWAGVAQPDWRLLDAPSSRLSELADALLARLRDQGTLSDLPPDQSLAAGAQRAIAEMRCASSTGLIAARIAWLLMRAWSRWLPGVGGASPPFLVRNCLERSGHLTVSEAEIDVRLDPAPFDVVLQMAGYYGRIERVSWLAGRRVSFAVRRPASR
jgi:hypothetical protein